MSTERLQRNATKLKRLRKASKAMRKQMLQQNLADTDFIQCICECSKNILNGNVPLTNRQMTKLRRKKMSMRNLADKRVSITKKKKIIQTGGFLGAILGPVVSVLGGLLGNFLPK